MIFIIIVDNNTGIILMDNVTANINGITLNEAHFHHFHP